MEYMGKWGTQPRFTQHWVARDRRYEGDTYETQVLTFEPKNGWPSDVTHQLQSRDFSQFTSKREQAEKYWDAMKDVTNEQWEPVRRIIQEAVNFAKLHDKNRRHWPDSFLSGLDNMAFNNIRGSTYVIVRDKTTGIIISTLRVFQSSHEQRLQLVPDAFELRRKVFGLSRSVDYYFSPETHDFGRGGLNYGQPRPLILEQYLPVVVERPVTKIPLKNEKYYQLGVGRIYEPGLWAIDPKANEIGITESLIHLLDSIIENREHLPEQFNRKGKMLYTYGDKVGVRLYSQLGFEPEGEPVEKDGITWQLLKLNVDGALNLMERLQELRQNVTTERAIKTRETLKELLEYQRTSVRNNN